MCCRFIIEKRSLRHCCVEGLSKMCGGLGIGERKGEGRGDLLPKNIVMVSTGYWVL